MEKPPATPQSKKAIWILLIVMFSFVGINLFYGYILLFPKSSSPASTSHSFTKAVPEFSFTRQDGTDFGLDDLKGKIWVASFVFTRCPGPCPTITGNLARLHRDLKDSPDIHFVTFSIDPNYDTPEVLTKYAEQFGADPASWSFLTGDQATIHDLSMNGFYSAVMETSPEEAKDAGPFIHGTRIYIVDQTGTIVASYDGMIPEGMQQTREKLKELQK